MSIMLYLDNAATTVRKPRSVYEAVIRAMVSGSGNAGRGANKLSIGSVKTIIEAQEAAAELFNVKNENNIIFTQNATYALNMVILGTLGAKDNVLITQMEHNSVLRPAVLHGNYTIAAADKYGYVHPSEFRKRIGDHTKLTICTHISNVCGTKQPVNDAAKAAHNAGALFMADCSQSAGAETVDMEKMDADFIACAGHKGLMGPMGTGILCIRDPDKIRAVITGGTGSDSQSLKQPEYMPDKFHSGTMNIPAIAGLKEGIRFVLREGAENIGSYEKMLSRALREKLENMRGVRVYGKSDSGITAFGVDGYGSEAIGELLGENIIVRCGYHCAPLAHKALGTYDGGLVRVSFGYFNRRRDVCDFADALYKILKNI